MVQTLLEGVNQSQRERLFHIDFKLLFLGVINRNDLVARFGIKEAAATRDLSLYRELAPQNLSYSASARSYIANEPFQRVFEHSSSRALEALGKGVGDGFVGKSRPIILTDAPVNLQEPQLGILAVISRAIHQRRALTVTYFSTSSGKSTRQIVPFALVDNGLRWHVRVYDRARKVFTDFNINRIAEAKLLEQGAGEGEDREDDIQWNRIVDLELVPHPSISFPETIAFEYLMKSGLLRARVRAAVVGYLLRRWNIDSSPDHSCEGGEFQLWLRNWQTLYGVESAMLAPGYKASAYKNY